LDELTLELASLLHGKLRANQNGRKYVAGGNTKFGAHSESELGGEALYHYQGVIVEKLYACKCEWSPENTLSEQLKKIASHVFDKNVAKYRRKKKREEKYGYNSTPVSLDVEWIGKEDDYTGEVTDEMVVVKPDTDSVSMSEKEANAANYETPSEADCARIVSLVSDDSDKIVVEKNWKIMWNAAKGDAELEWFLTLYDAERDKEGKEDSEHMDARERDRLVKRLRRKVNKYIKNNDTKKNRQCSGC